MGSRANNVLRYQRKYVIVTPVERLKGSILGLKRWLSKEHILLTEDPSSSPSTHSRLLTTQTQAPWKSDASGLLGLLPCPLEFLSTYPQADIYEHIN